MALRRRRRVQKRRLTRRGRRTHGVTALRSAYPTLNPFGIAKPRVGRRIGVGAKRRGRYGPRTATKRRRVVRDSAGYIQWAQSKFTRKLGRLTLKKQLKALANEVDFVWKRTGRLDGGGSMFAGGWVDQTTNPDEAWRPIFLVDLTSGKVGTITHQPVVQLVRVLDAGFPRYDFRSVSGHTPTGGMSAYWNTAGSGGTADAMNTSLDARSILKWSEIRADIWGAKEHPCEWTFTLCQFDEKLLPDPDMGLSMSEREGIDWWDQFASKLQFTPSERKVANGLYGNRMKVLDRRSFVINPTSTTESDVDAHCRSIRLFYRLNRRCNFQWSNRVDPVFTADQDPAQTVQFAPSLNEDQKSTVHPKARVFMMVTCANWRAPPSGFEGMTTANTGSFNLSVYNRWIS